MILIAGESTDESDGIKIVPIILGASAAVVVLLLLLMLLGKVMYLFDWVLLFVLLSIFMVEKAQEKEEE